MLRRPRPYFGETLILILSPSSELLGCLDAICFLGGLNLYIYICLVIQLLFYLAGLHRNRKDISEHG